MRWRRGYRIGGGLGSRVSNAAFAFHARGSVWRASEPVREGGRARCPQAVSIWRDCRDAVFKRDLTVGEEAGPLLARVKWE